MRTQIKLSVLIICSTIISIAAVDESKGWDGYRPFPPVSGMSLSTSGLWVKPEQAWKWAEMAAREVGIHVSDKAAGEHNLQFSLDASDSDQFTLTLFVLRRDNDSAIFPEHQKKVIKVVWMKTEKINRNEAEVKIPDLMYSLLRAYLSLEAKKLCDIPVGTSCARVGKKEWQDCKSAANYAISTCLQNWSKYYELWEKGYSRHIQKICAKERINHDGLSLWAIEFDHRKDIHMQYWNK